MARPEKDEARAEPGARVETSALYVQIPKAEAEKLDRAAFELKAHKRDLVAGLVARYVDPGSPAGLDRLRALGASARSGARAEIPLPSPPEPPGPAPRAPTLQISRASEWVAGMQRSIREFAQTRACAKPFVRVTLGDEEQLFLEAMTPGPDDDFVTLSAYELGDDMTRVLVVRLDAIKMVELLRKPPSAAEKTFVFHAREDGVGFASGR